MTESSIVGNTSNSNQGSSVSLLSSSRQQQHGDATPVQSSSSSSTPANAITSCSSNGDRQAVQELVTSPPSRSITNGANTSTTTTTTTTLQRAQYSSCCCCCCGTILFGNKEAIGWLLDSMGRSVAFIGAGAFLGTALIRLAKQHVGCSVDENEDEDCNERVFGLLRPSSLLTTYTIIVGLVSTAFLPIMGAVVDYTPNRLVTGRFLSASVCLLQFPQIFVSDKTWIAVAVLQMVVAAVGWAQTCLTHAYLPELTHSAHQMSVMTQWFTVASFGSMVLYLASVVVVSSAWGLGDVATARLGMAVATTVSCITLYPAWSKLLQPRPALRILPSNQSLWTAGFAQVATSCRFIYRHRPVLKWFYIHIALVEGAIGSLATIMITYLADTLLFSSRESGLAILAMLVGSIPGAGIAGFVVKRANPIWGGFLASILLGTNGIIAASVLKGPGQQIETYILGLIWGAGTGWKWTSDRLLISTILPDTGQDAELMGLYLFFGQSLTWLPPLLFTGINEAGIDQRIGLASISSIFFVGALVILGMGKYEDAVHVAGRIVESDNENDSPDDNPLEESPHTITHGSADALHRETELVGQSGLEEGS